jgi:hypothetical protein
VERAQSDWRLWLAGRELPGARVAVGAVPNEIRVFVFFSNRLGCLGSLVVALVATIVLVVILAALSSAR